MTDNCLWRRGEVSARVARVQDAREQFAANLRSQRLRAGLSQEQLAEVCGLHRTAISLLERRERSPRLETLVALAKGLDLKSAGELLRGISLED
jgi:transcriptional regulator with XRE-family HTH domain